jgi:hypothetical protein
LRLTLGVVLIYFKVFVAPIGTAIAEENAVIRSGPVSIATFKATFASDA